MMMTPMIMMRMLLLLLLLLPLQLMVAESETTTTLTTSSSFLRSTNTAENAPVVDERAQQEEEEEEDIQAMPRPNPPKIMMITSKSSSSGRRELEGQGQEEGSMIVIWKVADNGKPEDAFPLGLCDGDCDLDVDCTVGMYCLQRIGRQAVPGCLAGDTTLPNMDVCVAVPSPSPTLTPTALVIESQQPTTSAEPSGNPSKSPTQTPLRYIEIIDTFGAHEDGGEGENTASDEIGRGSSDTSTTTVSINFFDTTTTADNNDNENDEETTTTTTSPSPSAPTKVAVVIPVKLDMCQGICQADNDCKVGLICFRRNLGGSVPHCQFGDYRLESSTELLDFCTLPPTPSPTFFPTTVEPTTLQPTSLPTPFPTNFPTTPEPTDRPYFEEKVARFVTDRPQGDNPSLAICEGNCRRNNDCAGEMLCWGRASNMDAPGCYFDYGVGQIRKEDDDNLCIDKLLYPKHLVKLRMWWQDGYRWQDDPDEQLWCMKQAGDGIEISTCNADGKELWELMFLSQHEQRAAGENAVLIKNVQYQTCLAGGGFPTLKECNMTNPRQQWIPQQNNGNGGGDWKNPPFEITRKGMENQCLTVQHHPRRGEGIGFHDCSAQRTYTTSSWMLWWDLDPHS